MHKKRILFLIIALLIVASLLLAPFLGALVSAAQTASYLLALATSPAAPVEPGGNRVITANIVALDQVIVYNRLGAINPAGMIYVLRRDVVDKNTSQTEAKSAVLMKTSVPVGSCFA